VPEPHLFCDAIAELGPRQPHCWGFEIAYN